MPPQYRDLALEPGWHVFSSGWELEEDGGWHPEFTHADTAVYVNLWGTNSTWYRTHLRWVRAGAQEWLLADAYVMNSECRSWTETYLAGGINDDPA